MLDGVVPPHTAGVVATVSLKPNADYQPRFLSSSLVVVGGSSISSSVTKPEGGCLHHQAGVADRRAVPTVSVSCRPRPGLHASAYNLISKTCLDLKKDRVYSKAMFGGKTETVRACSDRLASLPLPAFRCLCRRVCRMWNCCGGGQFCPPSAYIRVWFSARARR